MITTLFQRLRYWLGLRQTGSRSLLQLDVATGPAAVVRPVSESEVPGAPDPRSVPRLGDDVVAPRPDIDSCRSGHPESTAHLWQAFLAKESDRYSQAIAFYAQTFISLDLHSLLSNAMLRLAGQGGDPIIELAGAGKTYSMLALYHLFSGVPTDQLPGMERLLHNAGVVQLQKVHRVVLVGGKISPADVHEKPDGTMIRTLWGELAWQLGGREGYEMVRNADEKAISPGGSLLFLLQRFSPCLISGPRPSATSPTFQVFSALPPPLRVSASSRPRPSATSPTFQVFSALPPPLRVSASQWAPPLCNPPVFSALPPPLRVSAVNGPRARRSTMVRCFASPFRRLSRWPQLFRRKLASSASRTSAPACTASAARSSPATASMTSR